jgi:hypothetical protein
MRVKLTPKQLNMVILNESKTRNIIKESDREVILGLSLLLGVKLSGLNNELAHKYINDNKIINKIKTTLSNEFKTEEIIKSMEEKGMSDAKNLLKSKSKELIDNFDKFCGPEKHDADMNIKIINNLDKI